MSGLFSDLGGFRMPDVRMNDGPLPSGGGINATPDGVINGSSSLLSNITPYAYGESARMGSDRNYQQIPHRVQYIVMPLYLPSADSTTTLKISHVVDQGDLAFVLNTRGRQWFGAGENVANSGPGTLPMFANLACVNYMLACLQVAPPLAVGGGRRTWPAIRAHLWKDYDGAFTDEDERELVLFEYAKYTVEHLMKPHGICAGSEKQGGQHEETWAPVQAAVNYTTTMTVDGQNRDLVNYWQAHHMCAGDRLVLRLELHNRHAKTCKQGVRTAEFQLTSYYKRPVSASVTSGDSYWQLVPHILNSVSVEETQALQDASEKMSNEEVRLNRFDYRLNGYWQIAQSFQGRQSFDIDGTARAAGKSAPLQVTFAPVFVRGDRGAQDVSWDWEELLATFNSKNQTQYATSLSEWQNGPRTAHATSAFLSKCGVSSSTIKRVFEHDPVFSNFIFTKNVEDTSLLNVTSFIYNFEKEHAFACRRRIVDVLKSEVVLRIFNEYEDEEKRKQNGKTWRQLMFGVDEKGEQQLFHLLRSHCFREDTCQKILMFPDIPRRGDGSGDAGHVRFARDHGHHVPRPRKRLIVTSQMCMPLDWGMFMPAPVEKEAAPVAEAPEVRVPEAGDGLLEVAVDAPRKKIAKKRGAAALFTGAAGAALEPSRAAPNVALAPEIAEPEASAV